VPFVKATSSIIGSTNCQHQILVFKIVIFKLNINYILAHYLLKDREFHNLDIQNIFFFARCLEIQMSEDNWSFYTMKWFKRDFIDTSNNFSKPTMILQTLSKFWTKQTRKGIFKREVSIIFWKLTQTNIIYLISQYLNVIPYI
jgi:hypothetical protein